ncbi:conjugal transfer protein TraN [Thalassotalea marina]
MQAGVRSRWDNCCNNGNEIVDEALDNYWDNILTMSEGITGMQSPSFIVDIITLYMYGMPAYQITEALTKIGNYLLTPCADDSLTSSMIATGRCVTVGTRCVEKLLGTCLQEKQVECCFASKLARIINEQGRPQLGIGWGTPKNPDCRGLTPEEFQSIDFSQVDLSEYIADLNVKSQATIDAEIGLSVADDINRIRTGG